MKYEAFQSFVKSGDEFQATKKIILLDYYFSHFL